MSSPLACITTQVCGGGGADLRDRGERDQGFCVRVNSLINSLGGEMEHAELSGRLTELEQCVVRGSWCMTMAFVQRKRVAGQEATRDFVNVDRKLVEF